MVNQSLLTGLVEPTPAVPNTPVHHTSMDVELSEYLVVLVPTGTVREMYVRPCAAFPLASSPAWSRKGLPYAWSSRVSSSDTLSATMTWRTIWRRICGFRMSAETSATA